MSLNLPPILGAASNCRHCGSELTLNWSTWASRRWPTITLISPIVRSPNLLSARGTGCRECRLVQTRNMLAADDIFRADYAYFSSHSSSWLNHARTYVEAMTTRLVLLRPHATSKSRRTMAICCNIRWQKISSASALNHAKASRWPAGKKASTRGFNFSAGNMQRQWSPRVGPLT